MKNFNAIEALENRLFQSVTPVPAAPTGLNGVVSGHSVTLKWTDNSNNETGFDIQRYAGKVLTDLGTVGANVTTFTDASAPVGLDYYVVRSFNTAGHGEGTNVSLMIKADTIISVIAPNRISIATASTTQLNIGWTGDAGATGGYTIQRSTTGITGWTTVGTTPAGTRSFSDKGLTAKSKYFYRIIANCSGGASATSTVFFGLTKATNSGDSTPTGLKR